LRVLQGERLVVALVDLKGQPGGLKGRQGQHQGRGGGLGIKGEFPARLHNLE
jgi:hypothetical protein